MSKLEFKIAEIPEEVSQRTIQLEPEDLEVDPYAFKGGMIDLEFYRTLHFIRVSFLLKADVELVCDRSLEPFIDPVETEYEVIFKVDVQEETADENGAVRRFNFDTNTLSIEQEVRDTLLLQIPIKKLHPRYLDSEGRPRDYETKSFGRSDDEEQDQIDPRWEALKKLKNK